MISRDPRARQALGTRRGLFVPAPELQILELQGWRLLDDLAGWDDGATDDDGNPLVLVAPPADLQGAA